MKNKILLAILIVLFLYAIIVSCTDELNNSHAVRNSIQGVWEYLEDDVLKDVRGMSFFTENHFAFVVNYTNENDKNHLKTLAYSGTYILEDSIVTATINYAHNPALSGHNLRWIHGTDNQFASYRVLDNNGNIIETGKLKRLE